MAFLVRVGLVAFGSKIASFLFWSILSVLFTGEVLIVLKFFVAINNLTDTWSQRKLQWQVSQ